MYKSDSFALLGNIIAKGGSKKGMIIAGLSFVNVTIYVWLKRYRILYSYILISTIIFIMVSISILTLNLWPDKLNYNLIINGIYIKCGLFLYLIWTNYIYYRISFTKVYKISLLSKITYLPLTEWIASNIWSNAIDIIYINLIPNAIGLWKNSGLYSLIVIAGSIQILYIYMSLIASYTMNDFNNLYILYYTIITLLFVYINKSKINKDIKKYLNLINIIHLLSLPPFIGFEYKLDIIKNGSFIFNQYDNYINIIIYTIISLLIVNFYVKLYNELLYNKWNSNDNSKFSITIYSTIYIITIVGFHSWIF